MHEKNYTRLALSATLHCLTGCAVGEIAGLVIGMALGFSTPATIILAISLAFLFGYLLSLIPLVRAGMRLVQAMPLVLAADTLSIMTMEVVDNAVVVVMPGAMNAGLASPYFWLTLTLALFLAFWAAFPLNRYLLKRGKGHALTHRNHK